MKRKTKIDKKEEALCSRLVQTQEAREYMLTARRRTLGTYTFLTIVLLNCGMHILPDYQITIASVYPVVFFLLGKVRLTLEGVIVYLLAIALPILIAGVDILFNGGVHFVPFVRSYLLYCHFVFGLLIILNLKIDVQLMRALDKAIQIALLIVGTYTILQVVGTFLFGAPFLFNPFGQYGIGGVSDPGRFASMSGRIRPTAFFWEPSVNAAVILMLTNYLIIRHIKKFKKWYCVQFCLLLLIDSATGLFASGATLLIWLRRLLKRWRVIKVAGTSFVVIAFIALSWGRMIELFWVGTSGYYRWGLPSHYLLQYIQSHPLGLPLGHLPYPLDNGLFVAIIYTGAFGVTAAVVLFLEYLRVSIRGGIAIETKLSIVSILLLLTFNGAFLTPEMSFLICLITLAWRSGKLGRS